MIEGITDSHYLEMLAHWFEIEVERGNHHWAKNDNECANQLKRIASKLRRLEFWSDRAIRTLKQIEDPDPEISKLIDKNF